MAGPLLFDRVQETASSITGTGSYTLAGAVTGFRTFGSVLANNDTCFYCATNNTDWEVAIGTWTTGGTLARTTILASSNSGSAVSWSAATPNIFLTNSANYTSPLIKPSSTTHAIKVANETALSSTLGNARGTGAVDLQTKRSAAGRIASGAYSTISGGKESTASGTTSVVCGGNTQVASGLSSFVGGGVSNTASGSYCVVGGGNTNTCSGNASVLCGGKSSTSSGTYQSFVGGGYYSTASGQRSVVTGGQNNTASTNYATIPGGYYAKADKYGQQAYASGRFSAQGDAQTSLFVLRNQTTNATPTELYLNGATATQRMTLSNDTSWAFEILVIARRTDADSTTGAWKIFGVIDRQTNAASTALVAEPSLMTLGADSTAWAVAVSADTTNGSLKITATGATSQTVNWVARVEVTETTG